MEYANKFSFHNALLKSITSVSTMLYSRALLTVEISSQVKFSPARQNAHLMAISVPDSSHHAKSPSMTQH